MTAEDSDDDMEDVEEGIPMQGEDGQHFFCIIYHPWSKGQKREIPALTSSNDRN